MPEQTWTDHQTDPDKLNNPRRKQVIEEAKLVAAERYNNVFGIVVTRDITSEDHEYPLRLVAGPHPSVPAFHIMEVER
jgi:hypothetical protein